MSDINIKEVVYDGCSRHSRRNMSSFNPTCDQCTMHARAAIVEIIVTMERRISQLEEKLSETSPQM